MERPEIIRVWGTADSFDLEFSRAEGDEWTCTVPPDTMDGQYAVQIWAMNRLGMTAYWTGFLYMCSGVCHLLILQKPYQISFYPVTRLHIHRGTRRLIIRKGCEHYAGQHSVL